MHFSHSFKAPERICSSGVLKGAFSFVYHEDIRYGYRDLYDVSYIAESLYVINLKITCERLLSSAQV